MTTKKKKHRPSVNNAYWAKRAANGVSYVITNIDEENCRAIIQKMKNGFPQAEYRVTDGECDCDGFRYRGSCAHVDFLSCVVDGNTTTLRNAKMISHMIVKARQFKTYKAEVIEINSRVTLLHIKAQVEGLYATRVIEWYSGLPVVTDINTEKSGTD